MSQSMTIERFLEEYRIGNFKGTDKGTQISAGWYDWFCKDSELSRRLKPMVTFLQKIKESKKFSLTQNYIFFKNNCPMVGKLYDSFSICDRDTGDVIYWVGFLEEGSYGQPKCVEVAYVGGWKKNYSPTMVFKTSSEAVKWFNEEDGVEYETKK